MVHDIADVESHLPLRPAFLHLLLSLAQGPAHGYGLKQDVESRTDGSIRIGPATLYESIQRMEKRGFIVETDAPVREPQDARARRYYDITSLGRHVLHAQLERLDSILSYAKSRGIFDSPTPEVS